MEEAARLTMSEAALRPTRVLVLDDDPDMRESLAEVLALYGSGPCLCVGSLAELVARGSEALACRLAILDVNLGVGQPSGLDAMTWLLPHGFTGKVVFLTGHAHTHPLVVEARRLPNVAVMVKPVDCDWLSRLLKETCS